MIIDPKSLILKDMTNHLVIKEFQISLKDIFGDHISDKKFQRSQGYLTDFRLSAPVWMLLGRWIDLWSPPPAGPQTSCPKRQKSMV